MLDFNAQALRVAALRAPPGHRLVASSADRDVSDLSPLTVAFVPQPDSWLRPRLVAPATAVLLQTIDSGTMPRPRPTARTLAGLILDGLLEIRHGRRWISGGAAHALLFDRTAPKVARGPLGRLSHDALTHVAARGPATPEQLAGRLYRFNTLPWSPQWREKLSRAGGAAMFVGLDAPAGTEADGERQSGPWRIWDARDRPPPGQQATAWKLYLSPTPAGTATAWQAVHSLLGRPGGPYCMKVGQTVESLLRPDRLVAYFTSREELRTAAASLRPRLKGLTVQGVPFTASAGAGGVLSWGADLVVGDTLPELRRERSWRGWLTVRLGTALSIGLTSGAPDPVTFALDRVSLEGINTRNWTPSRALLDSARGEALPDADH